MLSDELGAIVVSVEYRLAPEHPHPAHVEDCYAGLDWTAHHAGELDIDADRIAIYGASAGGGLTIATALMARDKGYPALRFQMPIYPMIDDRHETPSSYEITDIGIWDRARQHRGLAVVPRRRRGGPLRGARRGREPGRAAADVHRRRHRRSVPGRGHRLRHAPHARRGATELHVWPGAYHGAENFAPDAELSRRIWAGRIEALRRALA